MEPAAARTLLARRGGARGWRGAVAVRRRDVRMRSITLGSVMKATMRMVCPQRGQSFSVHRSNWGFHTVEQFEGLLGIRHPLVPPPVRDSYVGGKPR